MFWIWESVGSVLGVQKSCYMLKVQALKTQIS